jgi:hypothetical protein
VACLLAGRMVEPAETTDELLEVVFSTVFNLVREIVKSDHGPQRGARHQDILTD